MRREALSERIENWLNAHRDEAVGLAQTLVRIESVNRPPGGDEGAYQEAIAAYLTAAGAEVDVYELGDVEGLMHHPAYMPGRVYAGRPNVAGRFRGGGGGRSLLFSGHADTVREGNKRWRFPPFGGELEDGRLYGRGAYDMKGGMAAALTAIRCLRELGVRLKGDVYAESVVDEEYGGANGSLAARLRGPHADMAIIPEPSNLRLYSAHLGGGAWKATFAGKNGIAFNGERLVNALDAAVDFAHLLRAFGERLRTLYPAPALWRESKEAEAIGLKIVAGDAARVVPEMPEQAEVHFWIESYPGVSGDEIVLQLQAFYESSLDRFPILRECRPEIAPVIRYLEASAMPDNEACRSFLDIAAKAGRRALGKHCIEPAGAPFACDAFLFNLYSATPALVLGPAGGNAHAPDEYLELDSYLRLIHWYAELTADWCGAESLDEKENADAAS